jgi:UPF0755 protein
VSDRTKNDVSQRERVEYPDPRESEPERRGEDPPIAEQVNGSPRDPATVVEPDHRAALQPDFDDAEPRLVVGRTSRSVAQAERRRRRRRLTAVVVVLAVAILPFVIAAGWFYFQVEPRGSQGETVAVSIGDDWGAGQVGSALSEADVVDSALAFRIWATATGASPFEAGTYSFRTNMGARDAANVLKAGPPTAAQADLTLLLPPGLTLNQIADRVGQLPGHNRDTFLQIANSGAIRSKYQPANVNSLEGFLFPDTYRIGGHEDDGEVVKKLVARFDEIADRVGLPASAGTNGLTPYQTLVAGSLIQTEAKLAEDAPLISAVIRNRMRENMPLQIDSTLCFAKGGCPPAPTNADKTIDSPYNTYRIVGLPPTPIASVTEANLRAAINPAAATYKYYVLSDTNGKHKFANTLAEHEANVREARAKGLL